MSQHDAQSYADSAVDDRPDGGYDGPERRTDLTRANRRSALVGVIALVAVILAVGASVGTVLTGRAADTSAQAVNTFTQKRSVTADALQVQLDQQRCVALLQNEAAVLQLDVNNAIGQLVLADRDSAKIEEWRRQFAELARREAALRPRLVSVQHDCFDAFPLPDPNVVGTTGTMPP